MRNNEKFLKKCIYETSQLVVKEQFANTFDTLDQNILIESILKVLTPKSTKFLPEGWQNIKTFDDANLWLTQRCEESSFFIVELQNTKEIIGFLFLYELESQNNCSDLKFGYVLSETTWGRGLGTELIEGLVRWAENDGSISSISGGVSNSNTGSIRVLEKNGFIPVNLDSNKNDNIIYEFKFKC